MPNISVTRALVFYAKTHDINNLITFENLKTINKNYKRYLNNKKIEIIKEEFNGVEDSNYVCKREKINIKNDYSSNYKSSSDDSSSEETEINFNRINRHKRNSNSDESGKIIILNINIKIILAKIKKQ